jgi:transglutaminase-like putative cysteine protease
MIFEIKHTTTYQYQEYVSICHNLAMLTPRNTRDQICHESHMTIHPVPEILDTHLDFFGNKVYYFVIEQEHNKLTVTVVSRVEKITPETEWTVAELSWEAALEMLKNPREEELEIKQFAGPTDFTNPEDRIRDFAMVSFHPDRPLFDAVNDLMRRIYHDFSFTPGFTTVATPLATVMKERKGVCQDFAHLAISCIHAIGLPARYVSGYIETHAPAGMEKLTGVDASHAWFSVYIPTMGWVDFDPTNNKIPNEQYITVGWGRDYFDIVPLKGVIMSSSPHKLKVAVDVKRIKSV